jgi:feruloyl-CoA synthase
MPYHDSLEISTWKPAVLMKKRPDGVVLIRQQGSLGDYPQRIMDPLVRWAAQAPDRPWLAQREGGGAWRSVSYKQGLDQVRSLARALLDEKLSVERPLLILSDNSIQHALAACAAQYVGVPSAAVSTAYSLVSTDFVKLREIASQLTPGAVFVQHGGRYAEAINSVFSANLPMIVADDPVPGRICLRFEELATLEPGDEVEAARRQVGPDTIAKFLFTSGTTGSPKPVIQTNRMLCANQAMVADCYAFLAEQPPVVVDWAPWSHTASGNKVFNMVLYNGGTFYIDAGRPSPLAIGETLRNLREISPSWYFNVPAGFDMLADQLESDSSLRETFFGRLRMIMYAGAGMAQHTWDRLLELSGRTTGSEVLLASGLGATETGPFQLMCMEPQRMAGNIGIPAREVVLKLVPHGDRLEARLKSPSITPGYWRNPELTAQAFDEEGFYRLGDALRFAVEGEPARGLIFDGRIAENFKLMTGTWVPVGALRARLVDAFSGLVSDVAITGEGREYLAAIAFPNWPALCAVAGLPAGGDIDEFAASPAVVAALQEKLRAHIAAATGSAQRVMRIVLATTPPSLDRGELTDKGSINQRAVLRNRPELVEKLYANGDGVIAMN